jgi:hypothetical protein
MNAYGAYHVMQEGRDPLGMVQLRPCPPPCSQTVVKQDKWELEESETIPACVRREYPVGPCTLVIETKCEATITARLTVLLKLIHCSCPDGSSGWNVFPLRIRPEIDIEASCDTDVDLDCSGLAPDEGGGRESPDRRPPWKPRFPMEPDRPRDPWWDIPMPDVPSVPDLIPDIPTFPELIPDLLP